MIHFYIMYDKISIIIEPIKLPVVNIVGGTVLIRVLFIKSIVHRVM